MQQKQQQQHRIIIKNSSFARAICVQRKRTLPFDALCVYCNCMINNSTRRKNPSVYCCYCVLFTVFLMLIVFFVRFFVLFIFSAVCCGLVLFVGTSVASLLLVFALMIKIVSSSTSRKDQSSDNKNESGHADIICTDTLRLSARMR